MDSYKTIEKEATDEFIERRSRFIGAIKPVKTEEEALAFIEERKTEHWQATHNCWAYIIKDNQAQRYSDDGEPQGTAGIPILDIMRKEEIYNAVVVVTRYFGGIMLGAGGLIRAYAQGAKVAIQAGGIITMALCDIIELTLPYPLYDRFTAMLEGYPIKVLDTVYTEDVSVKLRLRSDHTEKFNDAVTQLTAGDVAPNIVDNVFAPI